MTMMDWLTIEFFGETGRAWARLGSLLGGIGLALCLFAIGRMREQLKGYQRQLERINNELRAINSGALGIGKKIRQVENDVAHGEQLAGATSHDGDQQAYQQAGLLLERGATIEEVVDCCNIAPAEAQLLAIMRHSAPSQGKKSSSSSNLH